jgi:hypothetical protein
VKLKVLYADDGHIVSLSWLRDPSGQDGAAMPMLRSGAEAARNQRFAIIEVDASLHGCRLSEIHERFAVADHGQGARLVERRG